MVQKRSNPGTAPRGWFVRVGPFDREEDAYAAKALMNESFGVKASVDMEAVERSTDIKHPDDRRLSKWLLDHMLEHPNRAWDMVDLRIFAEENQYAASTADDYIQCLIRLGCCKRSQYGSIIVIPDAVAAFRAGE